MHICNDCKHVLKPDASECDSCEAKCNWEASEQEEPIELYPELEEVTLNSCCYICLHFSAHNFEFAGECLYYKYYITDGISYKCRSYK